ncbi:RAMP superfamily CRISPR-associated protein [Sulfurisphaera javensis]|uniref:RAMP superfamily CRISPR-associated protein n=1 Tax=Sulfurisphaera javensis TaxID=2049879 RepID=A0AAT9GVN0_9CREN
MTTYLFRLYFLTPYGFRIGVKVEGENTLYALSYGEAFIIPATSWKGMFRRVSEMISSNTKSMEELYGFMDSEGKSKAGLVTFSDSVIKNAKVYTRPHVSIDRKKKTSLERSLFNEEIVYTDKVEVKAIVRGEHELWKNTLLFLRDVGYFIGQGKSRGIGYIKLDEEESVYAKAEIGKKAEFNPLKEFLK